MTNKVIIKSNKYGINLILDDQTPFPELLQIIADKFKESGSFFKDAQMAVSFEGRTLTPRQEQEIADTIMANSTIRIVSIIDSNKDLETLMKERVENYQEPRQYAQPSPYIPQDYPDMDIPPAADFYKGNLRSGQTLECASSVTLIGDVNPGATIISGGNIVVLGSLKGNACAGASGDENCFIFALDMRPIQLQIGDLIAKSPDKEKESGWGKKKTKEDNSKYSAKIAVVRDGYIGIEPMTKGCLDRL
ncbi:MAG: septum site-determining protein MinC [Lachnospiraceae bacterium]|nr:septum site-determining protein MinC [Lachnospiraceae bacterium]